MGLEQDEVSARRFHAVRVTTLCAALVGSCVACQHVPPAPIDAATNAVRLSTRSLTDAAVRDALAARGIAAPAENAWSLDQLTLAAWLLRADLATARAEVDAARAATGVEAQRRNPTVNMTNEKVTDSGAANPW